jgi:hypothetical protein
MLRASSDATGSNYKADAIAEGKDAGDGNIPHGALLVAFAEAAFGDDETALRNLRSQIRSELGNEQLVDSCGVIANFQRMVRIADGTGIPLDPIMMSISRDLRSELGLDSFSGAGNSRSTLVEKLSRRVTGPLLRRVLPRIGK